MNIIQKLVDLPKNNVNPSVPYAKSSLQNLEIELRQGSLIQRDLIPGLAEIQTGFNYDLSTNIPPFTRLSTVYFSSMHTSFP